MIAWTVATPDMMGLAKEASARITRFGGVEAVIFPCSDKHECHRKKLEIWLELTGPAWFYDSDWWMVQKANIGVPSGEILIGNPDNSPGGKYQGSFVDSAQAINSSLVGMDMSNWWMKNGVVSQAIRFQTQAYGYLPVEDEKFLNLALWMPERPTMFSRLSTQWNWCSINPPKHVIAVHAASQPDKMAWLQQAVKNYES